VILFGCIALTFCVYCCDVVTLSVMQQMFISEHYKQLQLMPEQLADWTTLLTIECEQLRVMLFSPKPWLVLLPGWFAALFIFDMCTTSEGLMAHLYAGCLILWSCVVAFLYLHWEKHFAASYQSFTVKAAAAVRSVSLDTGTEMLRFAYIRNPMSSSIPQQRDASPCS
jgi:hypothetical protein